jgi:hypothetical protein
MNGADLIGALIFAVVVLVLAVAARWVVRSVISRGHFVYEIDLADGTLWYIGECADLKKRMRRHESLQRRLPDGHPRKWWWDIDPEVQRTYMPTRWKWYTAKPIAKQRERDEIRAKKPPGNIITYKGVPSAAE